MGGALAWLAGIAWQTDEAVLRPAAAYAEALLACVASAGVAAVMWRRASAHPRGRPRRAMALQRLLARGALMLSVAGLAWASTGWRAAERMREHIPRAWQGHDVAVTVRVQGLTREAGDAALFDAEVLAWDDRDAGARGAEGAGRDGPRRPGCLPTRLAVRMPLGGGPMPRSGQRWRLHLRLHAPDGPSNPGGFDPTLSSFDRGVRAIGSVAAKAPRPVMLADAPAWRGWIDRARQRTRDRLFALIPDKGAAGVLAGLSVGDQSAIERDDWDVFRKAGLGHVVSISGTHIAMLGWLAAWAARRLWSRWPAGMHRWPATDVALWAGVVFSALYALLAGWGVPAQRTVWMMAIVALMRTGGRQWPWPLVWLGSAVVLTTVDPWCIRQAGFWLSYVAVGVLMSSGMPAEGQPRGRQGDGRAVPDPVAGVAGDDRSARTSGEAARAAADQAPARAPGRHRAWWRQGMQATRAAFLDMVQAQWLVTKALVPLILVCFGQVSLVGFAANLFAIPFFTLAITPLALLGMAFEPLWRLGAWLIQQVMGVLGWMTATPYAMGDAPAMSLWLAVAAVLAGWSLALPMRWAWRLAMLPFALVLLYLPQPWRLLPPPPAGQFQMLAADIGQGTAVLVRTARHALLFDTGPRQGDGSNAGDRILVPLFRSLGLTRLDMLMISHEDTDHVGGAEAVVRQVAVSALRSSLQADHPLRRTPGVDGRPVAHTACEAGQTWTWDGVRFEVLHPTRQDLARRATDSRHVEPNAVSCVLRVSAGPAGILLTGDIGKAEEAAIIARTQASGDEALSGLRSDVLLAPHHGSRTSSSEAFLRAVRPGRIVIQAARRNRYGHPSPDVIARYEAMALPWLATPDCGAFLWRSEDAASRCWRDAHRHYWQDEGGPEAP